MNKKLRGVLLLLPITLFLSSWLYIATGESILRWAIAIGIGVAVIGVIGCTILGLCSLLEE